MHALPAKAGSKLARPRSPPASGQGSSSVRIQTHTVNVPSFEEHFMTRVHAVVICGTLAVGCGQAAPPDSRDGNLAPASTGASQYLDYSGRDDVLAGGVKMIPITTPKGTFRVWTKRVGNNPRVKVLLLHGGPAA